MSKHRNENEAFAETQLIPKFPAQATDEGGEAAGGGAEPRAATRTARARHRAPAQPPIAQILGAEGVTTAGNGGAGTAGDTGTTGTAAPRRGEASEPEPSAVRRARIHIPSGFLAPETAAAAAATAAASTAKAPAPQDETVVTPAVAGPRAPIPIPPEFLDQPKSKAAGIGTEPEIAEPAAAAGPETAEAAVKPAVKSSAKLAPRPASKPAEKPDRPDRPEQPAEKPAAKPETDGHSASTEWKERVPFDETGVLMRPELLRHRAMSAETELISAIKLGQGDDGSEAAQAQRPGFWTGARPRRALLFLVMLIQTILTLRNNNTAFEDEALYLYSGHLELGHLLYGTSTGVDFWSYFSGAPTLYPVVGAIADQIGGLFGARLLALAFMLGTTGLLYLMTRRLFGTRAALSAAGLYCCTEGTIFVGGLATYDAPALFLLALSAWLVVRFAESNWPFYLLAAFPAALAVGTKYAALMFVPVVIALALLASLPKFSWWAWIRPVALTLAVSLLIWTELKIAGSTALTGVQSTTTARAQGTDPSSLVLKDSALWSGVVLAVALLGAYFMVRLPTGHRHAALPTARWQRVCLGVLLVGSGLLAPAYQMHLHTAVSLQKHVAFGLFFAAPLAGYGLVRAVGPNFHRVQLGIAVGVLTFALGMQQSLAEFHVWPNSNALVAEIVKYQQPNAHYLISSDEVTIYALRGDPDAEPAQFNNTFFFGYVNPKGQYVSGNAAYSEAVSEGYFRIIAYTGNDSPVVEQMIAAQLYHDPNYRLIAKIPEAESTGTTYYYIWVHK